MILLYLLAVLFIQKFSLRIFLAMGFKMNVMINHKVIYWQNNNRTTMIEWMNIKYVLIHLFWYFI